MRPLVDFEIFRSRKNFSAARKRARKRLFSGVNSNMVDQFIFGLERTTFTRTVLPKAGVVSLLRSTDMFDSQVRHDFVHRAEDFAARFLGVASFGIDPHARVFLLNWWPHVAEKSTRTVTVHGHGVHCRHGVDGIVHHVIVVEIAPVRDVLVSAWVHIGAEAEATDLSVDVRAV